MSNPVIINKVVEANQIDHNNHMHDSEYIIKCLVKL